MTNLGSASEVRNILGRSSDELADVEIAPFIKRAENHLKSRYNKCWNRDFFYTGVIRQTGEIRKTYSTFFPMEDTEDNVVRVWVNGLELDDPSEFTVDKEVSEITIASSFDIFARQKIVIEYVPTIALDYINYSASLMMLERGAFNVAEGTTGIDLREEMRSRIKAMENDFAFKPRIFGWVDSNTHGAI